MPLKPFLAFAASALVAHAELAQPDASADALLRADDECHDSGNGHCSLNALQRRGTLGSASLAVAMDADCHDVVEGEACWNEVQWAKNQGVVEHPEWYEGLSSSSSVYDFQAAVHRETPNKCPQPCSAAELPPAEPAPASAPAEDPEPAPPSQAPESSAPTGAPASSDECHDAQAGDACWNEIQWARGQGVQEHPDWYPGLDASSAAAQFQALVHQESPEKCPKPCSATAPERPAPAAPAQDPAPPADQAPAPAPAGSDACHDAQAGEACWDEIQWARGQGVQQHPDWYPGLDASSGAADFQAVVHQESPEKCPKPCSAVAPPRPARAVPSAPSRPAAPPAPGVTAEAGKWCQSGPVPRLWSPTAGGVPMNVKVLSYNLFWWNLFGLRGGNGDSAGRLIATSGKNQKYDFMGFQECEDPTRVLAGQGLLEHYEVIQGARATCIAYSKRWKVVAKGFTDLAEDMKTKYYGKRGAQWIRAKSTWDSRTVFFVNHHGPLSVNSGGICGGQATAHNLLSLMSKHAAVGDLIILVGDFNANAASNTIQGLWPHLVHVHNSDSWGGVDNIFSNIDADDIISSETVGSGGSDHEAISAVFAVGEQPWRTLTHKLESHAGVAAKDLALFPPTSTWERFWCGSIEQDIEYMFPPAIWNANTGAHDPEACCRTCQNNNLCKAWTWRTGGQCQLFGAGPSNKVPKSADAGVVSGLAAREAMAVANRAAVSAIRKE